MEKEHFVCLALGSNIGDREANLKQALRLLPPEVAVDKVSRLYETAPAYVLEQPSFLNIAVAGKTALSPENLLTYIKNIETEMGRTRAVRFGPRRIDLDIILYDNLTLDLPGLQIPHPRMAERAFVLRPLADVAPDLVHPVLGRTISELAADLPADDSIMAVSDWQPEQ
jgi:2-amino-4-hydroxy-6-hydroxymethyldihydropteridine diphosphokinase